MPDIKTRDSLRTVKTLDRAKNLAGKVREGAERVKTTAEESQNKSYTSETEYAGNAVQSAEKELTVQAVSEAEKIGEWGIKETSNNIRKISLKKEKFDTDEYEVFDESEDTFTEEDIELKKKKHRKTEEPARTETDVSRDRDYFVREHEYETKTPEREHRPFTTDDSYFNYKNTNVKTSEVYVDGPDRPDRKPKGYNGFGSSKKTIKTAEQSGKTVKTTAASSGKTAKQTAETTAKTTKKAAEETGKAAKKAAETAKKVAEETAKAVKEGAKAVVEVGKAVVSAVKGIVAAIAAGGWVAVVVIVLVCIIALVLGSVFGVFTAENTTSSGITIVETVQTAESDLWAEINSVKEMYDYDMCYTNGTPCDYSMAIAVYATTLNGTDEATTYDDEKVDMVKRIYREINPYTVATRERVVTRQKYIPQDDGSFTVVEEYVTVLDLYIDIAPLSKDEIIRRYGFDETQVAQFEQLLSSDTSEMWDEMIK